LESDGGMILTGENRRTRRKTCPSVTLSTTNPTWIDPGANRGLRGERPATNDLNHGTANYAAITANRDNFFNGLRKTRIEWNWNKRGIFCVPVPTFSVNRLMSIDPAKQSEQATLLKYRTANWSYDVTYSFMSCLGYALLCTGYAMLLHNNLVAA
jgi:hypothetical protein